MGPKDRCHPMRLDMTPSEIGLVTLLLEETAAKGGPRGETAEGLRQPFQRAYEAGFEAFGPDPDDRPVS